MNEEKKNIEQQPTDSTPDESGGTGNDRMFTQDDVNRIVSERLARERAKAEPSPLDEREQALKAGENRLICREYISNNKYPAGLLELFDTSDFEAFKSKIEQLEKVVNVPSAHNKRPRFVAPCSNSGELLIDDPLKKVFAPKC